MILLVALASLLFFWRLDSMPIVESSEARYAEVAREMVETGDFLVPRRNGIVHLTKPPLAYWFGAAGITLFGPNEWGARTPGALLSVAMVLVTLAWGSLLFERKAGFLAALLLAFSPLVLAMGRTLTADIPLAFTVVLAQMALAAILFANDRVATWPLLFHVAMGMAFLIKGPVGLMAVLLPLVVFAVIYRRTVPWRRLFPWWGVLVGLLIALPWYIYMTATTPGLLKYYLGSEVLARVASDVHERGEPFGFMIFSLLGGFLPWTFFLPSALRTMFSRRDSIGGEEKRKLVLLFLQVVAPLVVFMLSRSKQETYVLPLFPSLALLTGWWLARAGDTLRTDDLSATMTVILSCVLAVLSAGAYLYLHLVSDVVSPTTVVTLTAALLAAAASLLLERTGKILAALFISFALLLSATGDIAASYAEQRGRSCRRIAAEIAASHEPGAPVFTYMSMSESLPFYLNRRVMMVKEHAPPKWETNEAWRKRVFDSDEEFQKAIALSNVAFIVTSPRHLTHLAKLFPNRVTLIHANPHKALLRLAGASGDSR